MNLNIAADAALRSFMAGTFKVKQFVKSHDLANKLHARSCLAPQNLRNSCWHVREPDLGYPRPLLTSR